MRIVHLSAKDLDGGAARSAYRLHKGLERHGHTSSMLVWSKTSLDPNVVQIDLPTDLFSRIRRRVVRARIERPLQRYLVSRPPGLEFFTQDRTLYGSVLPGVMPECDVVNIHWVRHLLDYGAFFSHRRPSVPVIWTLHDMNPFTGGCHYDMGCARYTAQCGVCPQLGSSEQRDLSHHVWRRKRESLAGVDPALLRIVTPSRWLAGEVKRSTLLARFPVEVVPYGIDTSDFAPRDQKAARDVLGIPQDAKVLLFLAELVSNRRKGFDLLMSALSGCAQSVKRLMLMSLGHRPPPQEAGIPWMHFGFVTDDRLLSLMYSAADLFVIPSRQDNLPNTVLEALACGLPVVGFDVGGIPEMVRPGVTGLLAPSGDVEALGSAIVGLLDDDAGRREMALNCRQVAVEEYPLELQARRYSDLYSAVQRRTV
jgi:glycosyltransferase involved in cell wall biosynthesis